MLELEVSGEPHGEGDRDIDSDGSTLIVARRVAKKRRATTRRGARKYGVGGGSAKAVLKRTAGTTTMAAKLKRVKRWSKARGAGGEEGGREGGWPRVGDKWTVSATNKGLK